MSLIAGKCHLESYWLRRVSDFAKLWCIRRDVMFYLVYVAARRALSVNFFLLRHEGVRGRGRRSLRSSPVLTDWLVCFCGRWKHLKS